MSSEALTCKDCNADFKTLKQLDKHKAIACVKRMERLVKEGLLVKG